MLDVAFFFISKTLLIQAIHQIIFNKLEHSGICRAALTWFDSYLSNRKQHVFINGYNSNLLRVACCVPQGSVLGPLLVLICINYLPNLSNKLSFYR